MRTLSELARACQTLDATTADRPRLWIAESASGVFVEFFGDPGEEPFGEMLAAVAQPPVANRLTALILRGPDCGANGTCEWDLTPLLGAESYERLKMLAVEQGHPLNHNTHIVGRKYEESGMLGVLLAKAPALQSLTSPSAPDASFFRTPMRPLRHLSVFAGYDSQDFVDELTRAANLGSLDSLVYGEGVGAGFERLARAPGRAYVALFGSRSVQFRAATLVNPALSDDELRELKRLRPGTRLRVIRSEGHDVRG